VSSDLNYDFFTNPPDGSELGLGWNEVPPTFMGTATSFGQQPQHQGLQDMNYSNMNSQMNSAPPAIPPSTRADLLAASILQNAPNGRSQSVSNEALFRGQEMSLQPSNGHVRTQSISQYTPSRSNPVTREPPREDYMRDTFYTDMVFGSQSVESNAPRQASQIHSKADIRWGSDTGFSVPEGFVAPVQQRKEVAKMDYPFKVMEVAFMDEPSSTDNTRASSPILKREVVVAKKPRFTGKINYDEELDLNLRPRKRRKSSKFHEDDEEDESPGGSAGKQGKKRKSAKANDSPASDQNHKRRKSGAGSAAKATRENLTEDQKRENHIKSEQKRRTLIREGFEDLGELVPGLRGGGFSKSAVLSMSAEWLEDLMQGNEELRQRLNQMQGR
jgi:hypothetical protein